LYDLIYEKRVLVLGKEETDKILNTKKDYPHATGNTVDLAIVSLADNAPLQMYKPIEDRMQQVVSWASMYYQHSTDAEESEIHKNRIFLRDIMHKYGFEGIPHEYWHFNMK
jgi:D-alanyl-D-alanine dipeptidase